MWEEGGRVVSNMYKEHMDKNKVGSVQGWEVRMAGVGGLWWGENGDNCTSTTIKKCGKNK